MKSIVLATVACFGLALADTPRFAPEEKSSVEKTVRSDMKLHATEFSMSVDGNDIPKEMIGDVVLEFGEVTKLVITDRYVKTKDGRPIQLDRTFDEMTRTKRDSQRMPGQKETQEKEKALESALESKTVRFTWDAKEEKYEKAFAGGEGDAELLEGLREDLDFRGMLPKEGAKVGDTWKVDAKQFNELLGTGGDLHFLASGEEKKEKSNLDNELNDNMSGEAELKFEEVKEKDGLKLAVISFTADFKSHAEVQDGAMKLAVTMDPHGELLWDLEKNRMHSIDVNADMTGAMKGDQTLNRNDEEHKLHIEITLEGKLALEISTKTP